MNLIGTFDWSIISDSITVRNTDGIAVFTQTKLAKGLQKVSITGLNGKYNYLGDVLHDSEGKRIFTLTETNTEILRVRKLNSLKVNLKFDITSKLGDYSIKISPFKAMSTITNGNNTVMTCRFTMKDYDMTIDDSENPVFICSIFYGVVLLMNL